MTDQTKHHPDDCPGVGGQRAHDERQMAWVTCSNCDWQVARLIPARSDPATVTIPAFTMSAAGVARFLAMLPPEEQAEVFAIWLGRQ
jgi:hypothetical protein